MPRVRDNEERPSSEISTRSRQFKKSASKKKEWSISCLGFLGKRKKQFSAKFVKKVVQSDPLVKSALKHLGLIFGLSLFKANTENKPLENKKERESVSESVEQAEIVLDDDEMEGDESVSSLSSVTDVEGNKTDKEKSKEYEEGNEEEEEAMDSDESDTSNDSSDECSSSDEDYYGKTAGPPEHIETPLCETKRERARSDLRRQDSVTHMRLRSRSGHTHH